MQNKSSMILGFGGGCHWCTEAVFQPLIGIDDVRQGFIRADAPDDGWSEAVEVVFDPNIITLHDLMGVHLTTHRSSSNHKMRGKYRSAVYVPDTATKTQAETILAQLETETKAGFVTRILMHRGFKASDTRFHDYYRSNPEKPFCQAYIEPKLAKLRAKYKNLLVQK